MEVRLSRKDLQILDTGGRAKPSERPFGYVTPFDPLTNSDDIVEVLIHDENQEIAKKYDHKLVGRNSRLDSLQCFVLSTKIKTYNIL